MTIFGYGGIRNNARGGVTAVSKMAAMHLVHTASQSSRTKQIQANKH